MMQGFGSSPIELITTDAMLRGDIFATGFTYSATWITGTATALGASATVDSNLNINADADFVVQEIELQAFTAVDAPETNPDFLLTIVIAGSGRQIMNQAQHVMNYCSGFVGTNSLQKQNRLPMPILLTANTGVTFTLQNRSAQAQNRVDIMLRGYKVFYINPKVTRQQLFHVL